ncbi:Na(+)-dependent transporter [Photobacterium swingsii]|uniref:Bile acid:sodium symporter family protein n=1 Tax=Photobacterium swingsii TaxID=680026 RepID=A0A0J8VBR0_9GAMM|nr:bile acid:sodium symporter family protein [Photobacterium swingsii]KMV30751.1 Na(+)-dependent transporter [Photobacterium swingsii]PSW26761.1 bile acid:sodium symporter family protein [Photobacterium swingsii]
MSQMLLTVALPMALAWMMLCVGMTLSIADFKRVSQYPFKVIAALLAQLVGLPLLAYGIITLLGLPEPVAVGLWLLALAPGGASSNAITHLSGGDSALSITITAISSVVIPFTMPVMFTLFMPELSLAIPLKTAILQLTVVTLLPVLVGMGLRHYTDETWFTSFAEKAGKSALWALFFTVIITVTANTEVFHLFASKATLAVVALCLLGMALGALIARVMGEKTAIVKTFAIEVGVQNAGTAIFAAVILLGRPEFAITPLLYGILMNIPAFGLIYLYRMQQRKVLA